MRRESTFLSIILYNLRPNLLRKVFHFLDTSFNQPCRCRRHSIINSLLAFVCSRHFCSTFVLPVGFFINSKNLLYWTSQWDLIKDLLVSVFHMGFNNHSQYWYCLISVTTMTTIHAQSGSVPPSVILQQSLVHIAVKNATVSPPLQRCR